METSCRETNSHGNPSLLQRVATLEERERFVAHFSKKTNIRTEGRDTACKAYVLSDQCVEDLDRLYQGDYFLDYPTQIAIPKSDTKRKRMVYPFSTANDSSLLRLITFGLRTVSTTLPDTLYSFRPDKSSVDMIKAAFAAGEGGRKYALRTDIRDYGYSMDPELAIQVASGVIGDDPALLDFFAWLLRRGKCYIGDEVVDQPAGCLPGSGIANFFMGIYLMEMDAAVSSLDDCVFYGRYGDDVAAFFNTEEGLREGYRTIVRETERMKVSLNFDKTQLLMPGDRMELMGFEIEDGQIDPSRRSIRRMKKRLRRRAQEVSIAKKAEGLTDEEAGRRMIEAVENTFCNPNAPVHMLSWSRWAFPLITRTDSVKELDAYTQKCIRYVMTGTWGKGQYRVKYAKLRSLGYHPQVSKYYHDKRNGL